jgi:hypothetical protein
VSKNAGGGRRLGSPKAVRVPLAPRPTRREPTTERLAEPGREGRNILGLHPCVGYFDAPDQPCVYDPGWGSTPCLVCWRPLAGDDGPNEGRISTIDLLHDSDGLSLFYRVHTACKRPDEMAAIDASVMHGTRGTYDPDLVPEAMI